MTESHTLLAEYSRTGSEEAFRELVRRYIDLVYSTALRKVEGESQLAEDVAQTVFIDLARKANGISEQVMLGGWLHERTCHVAATLVRSERRRRLRERKAAEMNATEDHSEANLVEVRPVLDDAIRHLSIEERAAVLLRFFEHQDHQAVGKALGCTADAARMRISRGLDKLHVLLKHRGVTLSATTLGTILSTRAVTAAPAGLGASIAGKALAGAALGGGLSGSLFNMATMTKVQATVVSAAILIGATTSLVVQHQARGALREEDERLRQQAVTLTRQQAETEQLRGLLASRDAGPNTVQNLTTLRNEVEALRSQTNGLATALQENRRLRMQAPPGAAGSLPILRMREAEQELSKARLNYSKQWLWAFLNFANKSNRFPASFEEARPFLPEDKSGNTNLTEGQFEILYHGAATNIPTPDKFVVLREKQARQSYDGKWSRAFGFADGHSEVAASSDRTFDDWEKRHIIPAQTDQ